MTDRKSWGVAPPLAVAAFCLVIVLCGCDKKGEPKQNPASASDVISIQHQPSTSDRPKVADRMLDAVYTNALHQAVAGQKSLAKRGMGVQQQMLAMMEKARKALPQGATEKQVLEELSFNPDKYPGWAELSEKAKEFADESKRMAQETRKKISERIQREKAETKATR